MPFACALLFLAVRSGASLPAADLTREAKWKVIQEIDDVLKKKAFAIDFDPSPWLHLVDVHTAAIDKANTPDEFAMALTETMLEMHASHMAIVAKKTMRHVKVTGIGILPVEDEGKRYVWRVVRGGPGERAGVRPGDRILSSANLFASDPKGSPATVRFQPPGKAIRTVKIRPADMELVIGPWLAPISKKTAVLEVPTFADGYPAKEIEGLIERANQYENLVIDLRINPGGRPEWLSHFLSIFEAKGTPIGTFISREDADRYTKDTGKPATDLAAIAGRVKEDQKMSVPKSNVKFRGRVALLIGPMTGSAAEIVAQSLREWRNTPCVGEPTAGAVLLPDGEYLPSGYLLEYPSLDYVSARGKRLEHNPVRSDIAVQDASPRGWPGHPDPLWRRAAKLIEW